MSKNKPGEPIDATPLLQADGPAVYTHIAYIGPGALVNFERRGINDADLPMEKGVPVEIDARVSPEYAALLVEMGKAKYVSAPEAVAEVSEPSLPATESTPNAEQPAPTE